MVAVGCSALSGEGYERQSETAEAGWPGVSLVNEKEMITSGRLVAQSACASCHAIDEVSESPNRSAPPLRDVIAIYDPDLLAYRLIESMRVGHDEMPLFDFDVKSADALIAYLKSISGE
jgi:mono/diheme cytochrome c family protein